MKAHGLMNDGVRRTRAWVTLLALAVVTAGCHRAYYREQADDEAYSLIAEKANHPHWALNDYQIEVDPASRMFDPFDRDRPPMPPDDPESHEYMHRVDGKRGYPHWHENGDTEHVENPYWQDYLPLDEDGVLVLDARTAMHLALLHSRDFQSQLEELYLSALDVSFERFRFDTQFFGGYTVDYNADGPLRGTNGSQSVLTAATLPTQLQGIRANKFFTTGSDLVVGLANSLVWQFSGPDTYTPSTVLNFALVQPLLRGPLPGGGGRDRVMERLTLAERTLLANVRQMERFRRGFNLEIMTGVDAGQGPSRRGGVFGAGFEGFTGVGGGFGGVGGGGGGFAAGGGTGAGQAGGFMGLLQSEQEIRNQEDNLTALRSNYFRLLMNLQELLTTIPENSESVVRQRLQVAQSRQAVLNAESRLINSKAAYQSQLDRYKLTLGLPPQICVRIEDPMLDRVNLIDPEIRPIQKQIAEVQEKAGDIILDILPQHGEQQLVWNDQSAERLLELRAFLDELEDICGQLMDGDDAQIRRVRVDGLKLGHKLEEVLRLAIEHSGEGDTDDAKFGELERDADLLGRVLGKIEGDENWLDGLEGFNRLRDSVIDTRRVRQQITAGGIVEIDWMRIDSNPWTRDLYRRHRDAVQAMNEATDAERPAAASQIADQLQQEIQPHVDRYQQIVEDNPWVIELDRWRTTPDEIEATAGEEKLIEIRRLKRLLAQFVDMLIDAPVRFNALPDKVRDYQQKIDALVADGPSLDADGLIARFRSDISPVIPQELVDLANNVLELSLVQARDRAETVSLIHVDLHPAAALDIARANRRDWMNARASLVDSWRLIEFNADQLESTLDVVFSGDITNRDDNPFRFDAATGQLRAGLEFDAPLTRLSERNDYRQSLIEYQQSRRTYYAFQDQIASGLRDTMRTIQLNQKNFEIRREAVRMADLQIELNEDIRRIQEANRQPSGPTAARDAVSALGDLLTAQNDFLSVWVTYEVLRNTLDFNLGTMQLDTEGMWIDPGPISPEQGYPGIGGDRPCWPGDMVMPAGTSIEVTDCWDTEPIEVVSPIAGAPLADPPVLQPESDSGPVTEAEPLLLPAPEPRGD